MRGSKEPRAVPAPDANAELAKSMQVLMWGLIVLVSSLMLVYMKSDPKDQRKSDNHGSSIFSVLTPRG